LIGGTVRFVAAVVIAVGLLSVAGASAAGTVTPLWLAPEEVSAPQEGSRLPSVAMDRVGNVLFVWGGTSGVEALYRPAGGGGGQWARLGPCGGVARVAFDASGRAFVAWQECAVGYQRVVTAVRTAGLLGEWQAPVSLSTPGRFAFAQTLSVNGRGDAVVSWAEGADGFIVVEASVRSAASGAWSEAVQLSSTGAFAYESVSAISASGDVAVAFTRSDPAGPVVWSAFKPASGLWQQAQNLSQPGSYGVEPRIALDEEGNTIAVWTENSEGASSFRSKADGKWQPRTSFPGYAADIAVDSAGNALAVWALECGVRASRRPAGADSSWSDAVRVDPEDECDTSAPDATFDAAGNALVFWSTQGLADSGSLSMARARVGGGWEEPAVRRVGGVFYWPRYSADSSGNGVAVWEQSRPPGAVRFAILDAAAPALLGLKVPSTAAAGRAVRCSALFSDVSQTMLRWQFGDGTTAIGNAVRHVYPRPGYFRVRVTGADDAGHKTTSSHRIHVTR
jgi:PKD domain